MVRCRVPLMQLLLGARPSFSRCQQLSSTLECCECTCRYKKYTIHTTNFTDSDTNTHTDTRTDRVCLSPQAPIAFSAIRPCFHQYQFFIFWLVIFSVEAPVDTKSLPDIHTTVNGYASGLFHQHIRKKS